MISPESLDEQTLLAPLKRYWGYDSFRPLQERIVRSIVTGHDVAVVMPTGGGKSLCYQLPALVSGKTAVVISPLIALMQDQAAQLAQMGIPAAFVNSTMSAAEQSAVMREAVRGAYRLLYLSPERLARADTVQWLQRVAVAFFAIDEAHCISEWGHEFRPEYRQLSRLRQSFPGAPIAAFTASATRRVRHDILEQLQLDDPHKYIVSFHRPNLRYFVKQTDSKTQGPLLVRALRSYGNSNVIVYAPTIARVEETVDFLARHRIAAIPYHGQMDVDVRQKNQERWMADEVPVLVGTLAFGLGINKPAVRAVIHLALPKSIEQYYQEAGRAGRDGEPADCALLWQSRDAGLLAYFVEQLKDTAERERAWQRYHAIKRFADSSTCRHRQICVHFGETPKWQTCGVCDICGEMPGWMAGRDPVAPARRAARPAAAAKAASAAEPDEELTEYLKEWRREMARANNVPAFMVLTDATVSGLSALRPHTRAELLQVPGIGERKAEQYGPEILKAVATFESGKRAVKREEPLADPAAETLRLVDEGKSLPEIAQIRGRQLATVVGMISDLIEKGRTGFREEWVRPQYREAIEQAVQRIGAQWLKPLKEALPPEVTHEEIRLVVARVRSRQATPEATDD